VRKVVHVVPFDGAPCRVDLVNRSVTTDVGPSTSNHGAVTFLGDELIAHHTTGDVDWEGEISLYDCNARQCVAQVPDTWWTMVAHPTGVLVLGGRDGHVAAYRPADGVVAEWRRGEDHVCALSVGPNGIIAVGTYGGMTALLSLVGD
jgi:hypothetical protein